MESGHPAEIEYETKTVVLLCMQRVGNSEPFVLPLQQNYSNSSLNIDRQTLENRAHSRALRTCNALQAATRQRSRMPMPTLPRLSRPDKAGVTILQPVKPRQHVGPSSARASTGTEAAEASLSRLSLSQRLLDFESTRQARPEHHALTKKGHRRSQSAPIPSSLAMLLQSSKTAEPSSTTSEAEAVKAEASAGVSGS